MLKQEAKMFKFMTVTLDIIIIVFAFYFANYFKLIIGANYDHKNYIWLLIIVLPAWCYLLSYYNFYSSMRVRSIYSILYAIFKVHIIGTVLISSIIYLFSIQDYRRNILIIFIFTSFCLICTEKIIVKELLFMIRRRGYNYRNILVISNNVHAQRLVEIIEDHADWGLKIIGLLFCGNGSTSQWITKYPVLGEGQDIADVCMKHPVDEAIFSLPKEQVWLVEEYRTLLINMGITVRMVLEDITSVPDRGEISYFHKEILMATYYAKPFDARKLLVKRCIDIAGSIVGLVFTTILFPFLAFAIKYDSPGPLFFLQKRVGMNGRLYTIRKFRSMYRDAEERKTELLPLNEMEGALFKIRNDPRITRVGTFLRKTSLDELPQFWNVLLGEMSLVGTRPPTPEEVAGYNYTHRKRICIKPGITGLWQVSGRNEIRNFDEVVRLDIEYIDKWTLWLDVRILLKTIHVLFTREGAC